MADEKDLSKDTEEVTQESETVAPEKGAKTAKSDKADAAKKKGPGLGKRIAKYFRDVKGEFKKIIWPTLPTVVRNTGVTLAMCAVLGLVICVIDFGLGALVNLLVNAG